MKRIKSQMEVSFAKYIGEVLDRRGSIEHYCTAVRTASRYLQEKGLIEGELFEIESLSKLKELRDVLYADGSFIEQNQVGNNMYSVGLNHFVDFQLMFLRVSRELCMVGIVIELWLSRC